MSKFTVHSPETAPESSRSLLASVKKALGFVPNLHATVAESPAALKGMLALAQAFEESSLSPTEQKVVLLVTSASNKSPFDVAAESTHARGTTKVPSEIVDALRAGGNLLDPKLQALAAFTRATVEKRGWTDEAHLVAFLTAGYTHVQALEVVMGVARTVFSNYVDHLATPGLNDEFKAEAWERYKKAA